MKYAVYWEHKTGHPPVLIFEFEAKNEQGANKVADHVIPKIARGVCRVVQTVPKKGVKRGKR